MIQADVVERMAIGANLTVEQARTALKTLLTVTTVSLKRGEKVKLVGFGTFYIGKRKPKAGVHPKTGLPLVIPASKVIKFKVSPLIGPDGKKPTKRKIKQRNNVDDIN